jgi:hyperosmotically inducible protein
VQESKHLGISLGVFATLKRMAHTPRNKCWLLFAALLFAGSRSPGTQAPSVRNSSKTAAKSEEHSLAHDIRHQLLMLPYYSVFDYITFSLDGSKVTLSGQVVRPTLRADAEGAVKSIEGVAAVNDLIEVLPKSPADDELRRDVYRAIFEDAALQRYAVSEVPAIHILLKEGSVTLEGAVAGEGDKRLAATRATGVTGVAGVKNNLAVRAKDAPAN